ncbi:SMP-30/gluconolactonase/LRE family protein [Mycobacterium sp.]|uniref:SMP-30/gluconolactonase/LRE family protein n=1 Tax=Mycobacterium sp. TaxID=1785 RepID=UPI003BAD22D2
MSDNRWQVALDNMKFLECPRWHNGRLYVSDFYLNAVFVVDGDSTATKLFDVPNRPGGTGWLPDGRFLVVSQLDQRVLRSDNDELVVHADLAAMANGRLNDMVVARSGVAYVGNFGYDFVGGAPFAPAEIIAVWPDGRAEVVSEPLGFPNGSVVTPDDKTLIVAETLNNRISGFDILDDGRLGARRTWARFGPVIEGTDFEARVAQAVVGADGIALDSQMNVWVADVFHNRVLRVRHGGEIIEEYSTDEDAPTAVAFGGSERSRLFVCVTPNFDEREGMLTNRSRLLCKDVAATGICP